MSLVDKMMSLVEIVATDVKNVFNAISILGTRVTAIESKGDTTLYTSSGVVSNPKIFTTVVDGSNGNWSVDYSIAGFTSVISVQATAEAVGSNTDDRRLVCIENNSITTTGCSGKLMSASSAGLLAAMTLLDGGSGKVYVTVIGT